MRHWLPILFIALLLVGSLPITSSQGNHPGLEHLWPMQDGSGTNVEDTDQNKDGTLVSCNAEPLPIWDSNGFTFLDFSGTNNAAVDVGLGPRLFPGDEISISAWINHPSTLTGTADLFGVRDGSQTGAPFMDFRFHDTGVVEFRIRGDDSQRKDAIWSTTLGEWADNDWHLWTVQANSQTTEIYFDKELVATQSGPSMNIDLDGVDWGFSGRDIDSTDGTYCGGSTLQGGLAGVSFSTTKLTADGIVTLVDAGPPLDTVDLSSNPFINQVLLIPFNSGVVGTFSENTASYSPTTSSTFRGGVLMNDGRILLIPRTNDWNFHVYDPQSHSLTETASFDSGSLADGAIGEDGKVYIAPLSPTDAGIGIYDPETDTFSKGADTGGGFFGIVRIEDGTFVLVPRDTGNVGLYDPVTDTFSTGDAVTGITPTTQSYRGGVRTLDDRVIFVPEDADRVGIYDPSTDTFTAGPTHGQPTAAFRGGSRAIDGRIIFGPAESSNVGIFDPSDDSYTTGPAHGESTPAFGGVNRPLPDGRIIFAPTAANNIGIFDPSTDTYSDGPITHSASVGSFDSAVNMGGATDEDIEEPETLPGDWESPVGTDPIFNFPANATPRGVALTTNPKVSKWSIMTGYLTENNEGVIDLLKTSDQGTNIGSSNFRINAGDIEVGGMVQGPDLYKGCFQEEGDGGSRVMYYITKDGSNFQVLNAATHGTQPLHCDVATPRDEAGREDWTGIVYGNSFTRSEWFVMDEKGSLETPRVELPGSRQTGTDMIIRIKDEDVTSYVSSTVTGGSRLYPILGAGIHWKALADLNNLINIGPLHHIIETEGHQTLSDAILNSNLNHVDTAVSSVINVMIVWADDLNNEIKFLEADPRGTANVIRDPLDLKSGAVGNASDVSWIQIEPTGQGTYSGAYSDTDGNLVYFETNDNGATWNTSTIANDVPTALGVNIQKFDISYDRVNESIVLVWTTETGIRIAFKSLTSGTPLIDVERDWDMAPTEDKFREPDTFIGVNLQDQGDSTGIGLFGVKMLIIAAFTGLTIMFTYIFTFNAIMALGAGGSMSVLLLVVWGVMPPWVLIFLVFFCAYIITNHFTKRNNAGGETE